MCSFYSFLSAYLDIFRNYVDDDLVGFLNFLIGPSIIRGALFYTFA